MNAWQAARPNGIGCTSWLKMLILAEAPGRPYTAALFLESLSLGKWISPCVTLCESPIGISEPLSLS